MDQAPASTANHALEACERMLRPIMRLALDRGLKYQDIDELIRTLMLDEAARDWAKRNGKEPSGSQLSVTTGINRKEVKKRTQKVTADLPSSMRSLPAQVFRHWHFVAQANPTLKTIPIDSIMPTEESLASLVKRAGGDVHHRSVLDELLRLKLVSADSGNVTLEAVSFVPPGPGPEMLARCAVNSASHLAASISNVCGEAEPFLERAIWGEGISLADCRAIQTLARELWSQTHAKLYTALAEAPEQSALAEQHRVRVGTYVYFESMSSGDLS